MNTVAHYLEYIVLALNVISVIIITFGVIIALKEFLLVEFRKNNRQEKIHGITILKAHLGTYILLSLEILIVADIIETILKPSINDVIMLTAIVIIRTFISFFLNKEIDSIDEKSKNTL